MQSSGQFISVDPVDNFYQTCAFIPMSFALVTTVHENGETGIGPHALCFPFSITKPYSMLLISRNNSGTAANIRRTGKCALNYVSFDRDCLQGIANMGYPGMSLADKRDANPYTMIDSPSREKAADPDYPDIVREAFQVIECTWVDDFGIHAHQDAFDQPYDGHFTLQIDTILLDEQYAPGVQAGSVFPEIPVFFGYRANRGFWFAEHDTPFSIPLPRVSGMEYQSIYYAANRIASDVRFTEDACRQLAGIPQPFMHDALKEIVAKAQKACITEVDEAFLNEISTRH